MADAAKRSSANTDLYIGTLKASIGLFGTNAKPVGLPGFTTAGPNGGALKYEQRAAAAPEADEGRETVPVEPGTSDPLATAEPKLSETVERAEQIAETGRKLMESTEPAGLVDGEFRQVLVEEGSGEVVKPEDVRRGVRLDDGRFIDCTDQLAAIETRTKLDRMEVVRCIDSTRIRRQRVVGSYYLGAQDADAKPKLRLLYEALRKRREVAVVKYTTRSRQQLGVIEPDAKTGTLVLLTLVWSDDWREAPAKATAIAGVQVNEAHVERMGELLGALHGTVDVLDELRDDAIALREELLTRAHAGELTEVVEPLPVAEDEADLEDVLAQSLEAVQAGKV